MLLRCGTAGVACKQNTKLAPFGPVSRQSYPGCSGKSWSGLLAHPLSFLGWCRNGETEINIPMMTHVTCVHECTRTRVLLCALHTLCKSMNVCVYCACYIHVCVCLCIYVYTHVLYTLHTRDQEARNRRKDGIKIKCQRKEGRNQRKEERDRKK